MTKGHLCIIVHTKLACKCGEVFASDLAPKALVINSFLEVVLKVVADSGRG